MKNKYLKNTAFAASIYIIVLLIGYFILGVSFGKDYNDFYLQHTVFIDYYRQNFSVSHDLFPQWSMNYGLGQSFVIFMYHGLYNPYLLLFYLLPALNPVVVFEIIGLVIICLNTAGMTRLLKLNGVNDKLTTAVAVLSSFSGAYLYHFSHHPMFVYYIPIFVWSLVALHALVEENRKSYYMLCVGLIFFTMFTFAPLVSVLQFFYFIGLLLEHRKFQIKSFISFFYSYIIGVLMGMMLLIPMWLFYSQAEIRAEKLDMNLHIFSPMSTVVLNIATKEYATGIFIIGVFAMIGAFAFLRNRKDMAIAIPMLLIIILQPLNFAFNLFEYVDSRIYIMFIPLFWLLFAKICNKISKKQLATLIVISGLVIIYYRKLYTMPLVIGLFVAFSILLYLLFKNNSSNKFAPVLITGFALISIVAHTNTIPNSELPEFENARGDVEEAVPYRELSEVDNRLSSVYAFVPNVYTSLENYNYLKAFQHLYEIPLNSVEREIQGQSFYNVYMQNYLGISNSQFEVNPIVYGVPAEDAYSTSAFDSLSPLERVYAANQAVFVDQAPSSEYINQFDFTTIYEASEPIMLDPIKTTIDLDPSLQDGILIVSGYGNTELSKSQSQEIRINGIENSVQYADRYGINDNRQFTFYINTSDIDQIELEIGEPEGDQFDYSDVKIEYQSLADFEENKLQPVTPENFQVDLNNYFEFDLNMEDDGYLATTIPFDNGYTIYIDDQEVEPILVNESMLGAELSAGSHHIKISFSIPGFKVGVLLTGISMIIIIGTFISENKNWLKNRTRKRYDENN